MQCVDYDRAILKFAVGQICHSLGWNSMHQSSLDVLTDIVERYMKKMTKATAGLCQQLEHLDTNLHDLEAVFEVLGIKVCELEDYVHQVEPIHFSKALSKYPVQCQSLINFATLQEQSNRHQYYDEHLPPLNNVVKDEITEHQDKESEEKIDEEDATGKQTLIQPSKHLTQDLKTEKVKLNTEENLVCSPVEPKHLNLGSQPLTSDLTRPDLKVLTSKNIAKEKVSVSHEKTFEKNSPDLKPATPEAKGLKRSSDFLTEITSKTEPGRNSPISAGGKRQKMLSETPDSKNYANQTKHLTSKENTMNERLSLKTLKTDSSSTNKVPENHPMHLNILPGIQGSQTLGSLDSPNEIKKISEKERPMHSPEHLFLNATDTAKPSQPGGGHILKIDKKSKKGKKLKKNKKFPSKSEIKKSKSALTNRLGSPMLFTSPHLLKSPPDQNVSSQPCTVPVQRLEIKPQKELNTLASAKSSMQERKQLYHQTDTKSTNSNQLNLSPQDVFQQKKEKKSKKKANKLLPKHSNSSGLELSQKIMSPESLAEKGDPVISPVWKKSMTITKAEIKSPESFKSYNVVASGEERLTSPSVTSPTKDMNKSPPKWSKQMFQQKKEIKRDEKKHKKEKKTKKKEKSQPNLTSYEDKKSKTPSLKLTFKRSLPDNQQQTSTITASKLTYPTVSPAAPSPIQSPPPKATQRRTATPQTVPKTKKAKKDSSLILSIDSNSKVKTKFEPAVKIEPLVVNEPFSKPETPVKEKGEKIKKSDAKKDLSSKKDESKKSTSTSKKGDSAKKTDSAKKGDSTKKGSAKKGDTSRKGSASKKSETYQAEPLYRPPVAAAPTAEQSVSRGLFIQTITEAPTTQVWYCPSCLRPDDGSPMIGCDSCDGWYHWTCVGITQDPVDDAEWYCSVCVDKMNKKKAKRRKKKE